MTEVECINQGHRILYCIKGTSIYHREDGPAAIYNDGSNAWYVNGRCHREDGPAVIYSDGDLEWGLNGFLYRNKESWFESLTEEQKAKALYSESFIRG
jgi:hypothetical protein